MTVEAQDVKTQILLFQGRKSAIEATEDILDVNHKTRILHAEIELLIIDVEDEIAKLNKSDVSDESTKKSELAEVLAELKALSSSLKLRYIIPAKRPKFDRILIDVIRFLTTVTFLMNSSIFLAIPSTIVRPLDAYLIRQKVLLPTHTLSCLVKQFICLVVIKVSGIDLVSKFKTTDFHNEDCFLMCFNHSSNLDVFAIASVCPVGQVSVGKWDLFVIPFFGTLMISLGALPVDRKNRDQAVKSLNTATSFAMTSKAGYAIGISPEGTRSKSGLLLEFKKGPFYVWEEGHMPIVPVMLFGAYELGPPNKMGVTPGKVYIEFMEPIRGQPGDTRDDMSKKLRIAFLKASLKAPADAGSEPNQASKIEMWLYILMVSILNLYALNKLNYFFGTFLGIENILHRLGAFLGIVLLVTFGWYILLNRHILAYKGPINSQANPELESSRKKRN